MASESTPLFFLSVKSILQTRQESETLESMRFVFGGLSQGLTVQRSAEGITYYRNVVCVVI